MSYLPEWLDTCQALVCDGYRCTLSGTFDCTSIRKIVNSTGCVTTRALLLSERRALSESMVQDTNPTGCSEEGVCCWCRDLRCSIVQTKHVATDTAILRHFRLESLAQELLAADGAHGPGNLPPSEPTTHADFDSLIETVVRRY